MNVIENPSFVSVDLKMDRFLTTLLLLRFVETMEAFLLVLTL